MVPQKSSLGTFTRKIPHPLNCAGFRDDASETGPKDQTARCPRWPVFVRHSLAWYSCDLFAIMVFKSIHTHLAINSRLAEYQEER